MKLFKRKLSVIKEETPVEKIRLEDGELEAVSGGVVEGQSTESLCNDCAIAKYLTKPEDGAVKTCVCGTCGKTFQPSMGNLSSDNECPTCAAARIFGSGR